MAGFHVGVAEGPGPAWSNEPLGLERGVGWTLRGTGIGRVGRRGGSGWLGRGSGKEGNALRPCLIRGLCQPQTSRTAAVPLTPGPTVTPSHSPEAGPCVPLPTRAGVGLAVRYPQPLTRLTLSGRPHLLFHPKALPLPQGCPCPLCDSYLAPRSLLCAPTLNCSIRLPAPQR